MKYLQHILFLISMTTYTLTAQTMGSVKVTNVATVNSSTLDFSPTFYKDGIVFVSCNAVKGKEKTFDSRIHKTAMSIFIAKKDINGQLQKPEPFSLDLVTPLHEGPLCFDKYNEVIYFSRNDVQKSDNKKTDKANYVNGFSHMKIYTSHRTEKGWSEAVELPINDNYSDACHPSISADGNRLYFASNRDGGKGGMDIYMCEKEYGEWGLPVNLKDINTPNNEVFPYIHESGVLFYSKDGNNEKGDLDIFYTQLNQYNSYEPAQNIGKPINSDGDDFGLIIDTDTKSGYLTSDRDGGVGEDDIYYFTASYGLSFLNKKLIPKHQSISSINIIVKDSQTGHPLSNENVFIANTSGKESNNKNAALKFEKYTTDKDGRVIVRMSSQESYLIQMNSKNYKPYEISILKNIVFSEITIPLVTSIEDKLTPKNNPKNTVNKTTIRE